MSNEYIKTNNTNKTNKINKTKENNVTKDLTPAQYARMIDYIERKRRGENVGDLLLHFPTNKEDAKKWEYKYWSTKPVTKINEIVSLVSVIDPDLKPATTQSKMFEPYCWVEFNLNDDNDMKDVCAFLNKNYHLDSSDKFRLFYNVEYLKWSLNGGKLIGIRVKQDKDKNNDKNNDKNGARNPKKMILILR